MDTKIFELMLKEQSDHVGEYDGYVEVKLDSIDEDGKVYFLVTIDGDEENFIVIHHDELNSWLMGDMTSDAVLSWVETEINLGGVK